MRKLILLVMLMISLSLTHCTKEAWLQWLYGGYTYNIPYGNQSWGWWNQGWSNNVSVNINTPYFNGNIYIPIPTNIYPRYYDYSYNRDRCYINFYDGFNRRVCSTDLSYRNNNFYYGNYWYYQ